MTTETLRLQPAIKKPVKKLRREFTNRAHIQNPSIEEEVEEHQQKHNYDLPYTLMIDMMDLNTKLCYHETNFEQFQARIGQYRFKELDSGKMMILDVKNSPMFSLKLNDSMEHRLKSVARSSTRFDNLNSEFKDNYKALMENYLEVVNNPDERVQKGLERITKKTKKTMDYIESRYPYYRVTSYADRDSTGVKITSFEYSEKFLKKLGYSFLEFFQTYADSPSFPNIFGELNYRITSVFENVMEGLINMLKSQKPQASGILKNCMIRGLNNIFVDSNVQVLTTFEPKENGFLFHFYVVCHKMKQSTF